MKGFASLFLLITVTVVTSDTCIDELSALCPPSIESTPIACSACAKANRDTLMDADCTILKVTAVCKNAGIVNTCKNELAELCSEAIEDNPTAMACGQCAQTNSDILVEAGCTPASVTALCKNVGNNNGGGEGGGGNMEVPDTVLPTGATSSDPLRVFIESGQSNCVGQASSDLMNEDPKYDELKGYQDGIWFAGLQTGATVVDASRFYIGPMLAGEASKNGHLFGPEVSLGRRLYDARREATGSSAPVLVIKYCWGGSNMHTEWNPSTPENTWNREEDDGTALYLLNDAATDLNSKKHLYGNLMYTVRRSLELLEEGNIPYKLSGFFWFQGSADKHSTWQEYGEDTLRMFESLRKDLGEPFLPIVDEGTVHHNTITGKYYAASVIEGCNTIVTSASFAAPDPDADCIPSASNACPESSFIKSEVMDHYGYDPAWMAPEFAELLPLGANKTFHWFKAFPNNQHAEYEYKILQGRASANAYVQAFTNDTLLDEWKADDIAIRFSTPPCDPDVNDGKPSEGNICWMDLREDADREEATCSDSVAQSTDSMKNGNREMANVSTMSINSNSSSSSTLSRWSPSVAVGAFFGSVGVWAFA